MEMKVYTRVEYQMTKDGMVEISSDSYEYEGFVSEAKGGGSPPPQEPPKPETPKKEEVRTARIQAQEATGVSTSRRRRGGLGRISSLLSGGYRGFGQEDKLG